MLDIKLLREAPEELEKLLKTKDSEASVAPVIDLDKTVRSLKNSVEELKSRRNSLSKEIGMKKKNGEECSALMEEVAQIGAKSAELEGELRASEERLEDLLARLPNPPMSDVAVSPDPADNVCIKTSGVKRSFDFEAKNHVELNEKLHFFDFPRGAKTTGTGWPIYRGNGAQLEWALLNYMLDTHRKNGFEHIIPPHLVRDEMMYGSGQLPKFADQAYKMRDKEHDFYLIPTSEVVLNGMHSGEILEEKDLPIKYASYTPCFRREAGAAGSQERGIIRVHQFNKVEMFCFTTPDQSIAMFDEMVAFAENLLEGLGMHYRSMKLVTGDMSFSGAKTVDVEVWLPGQDRYYEVSSVSNCTDFQARRSKIRYKNSKKEEKPRFVHTLNGSGLATSRLMVALMENNQQPDGSIEIPEVLRPYLGGKTHFKPE